MNTSVQVCGNWGQSDIISYLWQQFGSRGQTEQQIRSIEVPQKAWACVRTRSFQPLWAASLGCREFIDPVQLDCYWIIQLKAYDNSFHNTTRSILLRSDCKLIVFHCYWSIASNWLQRWLILLFVWAWQVTCCNVPHWKYSSKTTLQTKVMQVTPSIRVLHVVP